DSLVGREVLLVGTIDDPPHVTSSGTRFGVKGRAVKLGSVMVRIDENVRVSFTRPRSDSVTLPLHYGMTLALQGKISRPSDSRNPGEFSEKQYYEANGITLFMLVRGGANVVVLDSTRGSWIMKSIVVPAYEYTIRVIDANTGGEAKEFLKGLLIGERSGISAPTRVAFTNSGVAHVLAVSGSNVVVVAAVFFFLFGLLRFPKWAVVVSSIVALIFYMLVTGSQPPVVRATIVSSIFLLGSLIQVRANPYNSLGVAALTILSVDARQLFDVGFQLSFVAVLSIVYLYPKMNGWISRFRSDTIIRRAVVWTLRVCAVSVAASLGTLPLTAVYFGKVSLIGLLANIFVIPAVGASVILGFVTLMVNTFSPWVAAAYAAVNQLLLDVTLWIIRIAGAAPLAFMDTSRFLAVYSLPFYLALFLLFNLDNRDVAKRFFVMLLVSLNLAVFIPPSTAVAASPGKLRVAFLDVGQGDGAVVELPDGRVMVIDAGPRSDAYNAGDRVVAPFLRRRGISNIDLLVVSHPDDDHLGGVPYLLEHFEVKEVMESGQPTNSRLYRDYSADLVEERCQIDTARSGMAMMGFCNMRLYVLSPGPEFIESDTTVRHLNLNRTSVVLRMQYGDVSFLFTGDAETEAEEEMISRYGPFLKSTLLKVGHHGSRTSSTEEFLDVVQPQYAVISVGRYNRFGHPSPEVLTRLSGLDAEISRTDEEGAIIFESDGKTLTRVDWR
ncbi:MAG TPA: DNA internalization-related competence protein ComEC/Rec2, partial [Bacteroidetes bacterium]|nr:DNA internalization-related competence protein ComEC/Rec2 [Bacteroidota bacterium]